MRVGYVLTKLREVLALSPLCNDALDTLDCLLDFLPFAELQESKQESNEGDVQHTLN